MMNQQKNKDRYKSNALNEANSLIKVQKEFQESFLRHSGWVPLLEKYVNVETGLVTSDVPVDIWQFQEEIVRKFSNFLISKDDVYTYFLGIKNQLIGLRNSQMPAKVLQDLVRELCRPSYYRECVDCPFFQQKCERMRAVVDSQYDEVQFREFLDFLSDKRKQYTEQANALKSEKISSLIGKASSMRKKSEVVEKKKVGLKKFYDDCKAFIILEETGNSQSSNANRKNKIIISSEKSRVSIVYEIIQKLSAFEQFKLIERAIAVKDSNPLFQFELKGNEVSILGEQKGQKQKAKESCCENVVKMIISSYEDNPESISEVASLYQEEQEEEEEQKQQQSDYLLFSPDELYVAEPKTILNHKMSNDDTSTHDESSSNNLDVTQLQMSDAKKQTPFDRKKEQKQEQQEQQQKQQQKQQLLQKQEQNQQQISNKEQENGNEFDKLKVNLNKIRDELGVAAQIELNPYTMIKRLFPDSKKCQSEIQKINNLLLQIILSAVKLYDYEEFIQSPCVLVQENNNTFFLKTLIMKKKFKNKQLIGRVRSMNEEQVFICSALELIYKFAFKHQSHNGDILSLNQVINGLIIQAEHLSSEFETEKQSAAIQKLQFTDKMQPHTSLKQSNKSQNARNFQFKQSNPTNLQDQFKLVL